MGVSLAQQAQPEAVFRATTKLIQVSVIAQDKKGMPVSDLRREDFQIFDNGAPQEVRLFIAEKPEPPSALSPELLPPNTFSNVIAGGQSASGSGGRSGYSVILFDNLVTQFGDPLTGKEGTGFGVERVLHVVRTIPEGEKIAIYAIGRKLQVLRDFTTDRESLERQLRAWKPSVDDATISVDVCSKPSASPGQFGALTVTPCRRSSRLKTGSPRPAVARICLRGSSHLTSNSSRSPITWPASPAGRI